MTFLPIVERELRVAARKRSSFWVRVAAALVGVVLGGACMVLASAGPFWSNTPGTFLFGALTWISLAAVLSAGLFFTSDCVSEEKREGTLGFLFLTDLRGYDVVAGKLLATSLRGFYALIAIFPILAATLLMGGVTGAQFWKTSLALLNALVFSLAAGLFISTISRDSQKAMGATLLLLLLLTLGGPISDGIRAAATRRGFDALWSLSSPGYVFRAAGAWGRTPYWQALGTTQAIAWSLLALGCWLVPRTWQQRGSQPVAAAINWAYIWKFGSRTRRERLRRKLMDRNPILWLACRERWQVIGLWALAILVAIGLAFSMAAPSEAWMVLGWLGGLLTLAGYLWMASQAGRFFIDARRSGLTELFLAAPLTERQIVSGQWKALMRLFGAPVLVLLAAQLISGFLSQLSMRGMMSQVSSAAAVAAASATNSSVTITGPVVTTTMTVTASKRPRAGPIRINWNADPGDIALAVLFASASTLATAANLVALCWFGMWMGVTSRAAHLATLKTILFVQVIPWFVISFVSSMVPMMFIFPRMFSGMSSGAPNMSFMTWYPAVISAVAALLAIAKDTGFIVWSRKQLFSRFRQYASWTPAQARFNIPPPLTPEIAKPPMIGSTP